MTATSKDRASRLRSVHRIVESYWDEGPENYGWQSSKLSDCLAAILEAADALAASPATLAEQARGYIAMLEESRKQTDEATNIAVMWQRKALATPPAAPAQAAKPQGASARMQRASPTCCATRATRNPLT